MKLFEAFFIFLLFQNIFELGHTTNVDRIAQEFITQYYQMFDTNRERLTGFYTEESVLYFEGLESFGVQAISSKLQSLQYDQIQHAVSTRDAALTVDNGLIVFVTGKVKTDDNPLLSFSEVFYLKQIGDSLFIMGDMFRLTSQYQ